MLHEVIEPGTDAIAREFSARQFGSQTQRELLPVVLYRPQSLRGGEREDAGPGKSGPADQIATCPGASRKVLDKTEQAECPHEPCQAGTEVEAAGKRSSRSSNGGPVAAKNLELEGP
jgi:hypothetical protein